MGKKNKWENVMMYEDFEEDRYENKIIKSELKHNKKNRNNTVSCQMCGKKVKIKMSEINKIKCKCGARVIQNE